MIADNLLYNKFLGELEELDPGLLTTEEAMEGTDCEYIAEVLAEAAAEVFDQCLEELLNTIKMEFTTIKEDLR